MHIAFVNPQGNFDPAGSYLGAHPDFGGQLVYVREVALALAGLGHRVDILTRRIADPDWPEFAADRDTYPSEPNVRVLRVPCGPPRFLPKEEMWPHLGEWVERIARQYAAEGERPDLWTGHYADGGLSAALLAERTGASSTFTAHSLGAWKLDQLLAADGPDTSGCPERERLATHDARYNFGARLAAERASIARAAALITNGASERFGLYAHPAYRDVVDVEDDRRFAVSPPGVDLTIFGPECPSPREGDVRAAIARAIERDIAAPRRGLPAVIAWSRLDPKKNHLGLVRAFAGARALRDRANLLLITRGLPDPLRDLSAASPEECAVLAPLIEEIDREGLRGGVAAFHLEGQHAVAALYRWGGENGSAFCLPSRHEPFGLSILEAMACGLPVVATANGGPREITDEGKYGLLADPDDPAELASQLLRLVGGGATWRMYATRGRERVRAYYGWRNAAEAYAGLAAEIVRGERRGDHAYPLPDFIRRGGGEALPRLVGWRTAGEAADASPRG